MPLPLPCYALSPQPSVAERKINSSFRCRWRSWRKLFASASFWYSSAAACLIVIGYVYASPLFESPLSLSPAHGIFCPVCFCYSYCCCYLNILVLVLDSSWPRAGRSSFRQSRRTLFAFLSVLMALCLGSFLVPARHERALFPLAAHTHTHTLASPPFRLPACCGCFSLASFFSSFASAFSALLHNQQQQQ